jgi:hypothetical protein
MDDLDSDCDEAQATRVVLDVVCNAVTLEVKHLNKQWT